MRIRTADRLAEALAAATRATGDETAQAIAVGVLAARWLRGPAAPFTRETLPERVRRLVPAGDARLEGLLGEVVELVAATDVERVFEGEPDPAVHFYERFLDAVDRDRRRRMGVWSTPREIVDYVVRAAHRAVIDGFGLPLGLADPTRWGPYAQATGIEKPPGVADDDPVVRILDPSAGTGAFLVRVVEVIFETLTEQWRHLPEDEAAARWRAYVREDLLPRVEGCERMQAPHLVCHLRLALALERGLAEGRGRSAGRWGVPGEELRVHLGDALGMEQGDVSVIVGNPPWDAVAGDVHGLLADPKAVLRARGVVFSQDAHLDNLYVYFLRWAGRRVFERRLAAPGVVAMVTPNAWFDADGAMGLRKLARDHADAVWCVDLGGEGRGADAEANVFGVRTAVAVSVALRSLAGGEAQVRYLRVRGSAREKLDALASMAPLRGPWRRAGVGDVDPFVPPAADAAWRAMPALGRLFPWQQPGCKVGRTWPIAPDPDALGERWDRFVASDQEERAAWFVTAPTGRRITTRVGDLPPLADLREGATRPPIVRYGYRSFDRQWTLHDPRLAALERPSLWAARSERQLFLVAPMTKEVSAGPCLVASAHVPDLDHFRGSFGGKDVIPLYRGAREPNVTRGLLDGLGATPEDLAAYVYALLSSPRYEARFAAALADRGGPRVPVTRSRDHWERAVRLGEELLWLHTFAERFGHGRGTTVPEVDGLGWARAVATLPASPRQIAYDPATSTLAVGDGRLVGVRPAVWAFEVSGLRVVRKWLSYRTASGAGRAARSASPLDAVRPWGWPSTWSDELLDLLRVLTLTVDRQPEQAALLDAICDGPLVPASELPEPEPWQSTVPRPAPSSRTP